VRRQVQAQPCKHYVEVLTGIKVRDGLRLSKQPHFNTTPPYTGRCNLPNPSPHLALAVAVQCKLPKVSGVVFKEQVSQLQFVPLDKARCAPHGCKIPMSHAPMWPPPLPCPRMAQITLANAHPC
jgi:hypothetical protein